MIGWYTTVNSPFAIARPTAAEEAYWPPCTRVVPRPEHRGDRRRQHDDRVAREHAVVPGERNADRHRETGRHHLVVAPGLTDLGGPRINTRPVAVLPLIHVETPRFEVGKRFTKRAFDLVIGGLLLLVLSPVMAVTALSIRLVGIGPVLTREQRIGSGGRPFTLLGFGSVDARRPGARRRRFGLDEVPQLFSVLTGTMSLVGPRAPLEDEVTGFNSLEHRRFLMKPGMTGLGELYEHSTLPWEERLRLDMYYIENWSIVGDVIILWRTARAARRRTRRGRIRAR
ncbi:sugar transferase [Cryobacterium sp. MDB2-10]|uniref:Sugar transferase n=1 Tax=Cryobacterium glucosi TaxID=1259175 RepID=A0ABY2IL71_9MICO|nr:sugar transferase [Cryobacterium sp. MDB2-A-1]TFC09157.1 sugar transferase [Cryobacterium sp. MDB2-A-2]TFC18037.1 sugar transferase [Cryobacterium glucosi]TFC22936.1 sugar transferase [Cryobacterium sp. MDB2-10]